jgi:hypothetical protein
VAYISTLDIQTHTFLFVSLSFFFITKMPAAVKVTLPKLAANTKPFANALKLSIAAQVTGAKLVETPGEVVAFVVSNELTLTDANAALK